MYDLFALKRKHHFREYSLQTSSIHCNVFGDVLIHDTSSTSEGAQALMLKIPVLQLHCSSSTSKSLIKTKYSRPESTPHCGTPSETVKYLD
jgi:hypothetical protein